VIGAAYEARDPQLAMAEAVQHAVLTRTPLVVEAGTGTGKSLAYLAGGLAADAHLVVSCRDRCYKFTEHRIKKSPERRIKCTLLIPIRRYSHVAQGGLHHDESTP
jgi:hypothetical protein